MKSSKNKSSTQREGKRRKKKNKKNPELKKTDTPTTKDEGLSLASRLKRKRGTAATTPLPPEWSGVSASTPNFLTPSNGDKFKSCVQECYQGFAYEKPAAIPSTMHEAFSSSFDTLNDTGLFLYDVVQPGGKKLSLTFVTRTLIGDPGSTYKYLGLRLFSHPWCDIDQDGDSKILADTKSSKKSGKTLMQIGYSKQCARALIQMGEINLQLKERTENLLKSEIAPKVKEGLVGSAKYSLTLINKMEPTTLKKDLKSDSIHGMGKTSVSWHKDSGLQDFSSIAVYHTLKTVNNPLINDVEHRSIPWKVALRVASSQTRTPALAVPLPSGTLYYLLDDFNHSHEHAVVSGSDCLRYSSTHRVARDGAGTWQYIRDKCKAVLSSEVCKIILNNAKVEEKRQVLDSFSNSSRRKQLVKEVRSCQRLITELEFEWIRQWYIQGRKHARLHPYWNEPIERLQESYKQLILVTSFINGVLQESSIAESNIVSEDLFDVTIEAIENRHTLRNAWDQRLKDSIFKTLDVEERPFECSLFKNMICIQPAGVREWKSSYINLMRNSGSAETIITGGKRKRSKNNATLTKKEKRKVASNWERMKKKKM